MVAASTLQALRLVVVGRGGQPTGGEEQLVALIRKRLNAALAFDTGSALRLQLQHGLEPIVLYLRASLPENDFSAL